MFKRVTIVALVVAAFVLVMAVPALAFNGMRADYTVTSACAGCHSDPAFLSAPVIYPRWQHTKHGTDEEAASALQSLPYGSVCAGCHTANYDPAKVTPSPSGTTYVADPGTVTGTQQSGNSAASELDIGCSSCHYGAAPVSASDGRDANDTAHNVPFGEMANADICGACHSRYAYTVNTYAVTPVPNAANPTPLIQPQMALGYNMLGTPKAGGGWNPAAPLSTYLNIPNPNWTPTPNPAATTPGFGRLQTYWQVGGQSTPWQQLTHEGNSGEYPEWANEGHANALTILTSQSFWGFLPEATKQECLECHSADFRIMKKAGKTVTSADVKYGITCVGCHAPHDAGTVRGAWDEELVPQLNNDASLNGNGSNLCVECHNGEIPEGTTASPGSEIHHPMKEMMDGYGAIDVSSFPSVHKGKCVKCHMPPTYWQRGGVQLGGNHTFTIIEPEKAVEASPVPISTVAATATASPSGTVTVTNRVTYDSMPYSACSTCHNNNIQPSPKPVSTTTATPTPTAVPLVQVVTVTQMANGAQVFSSATNTWSPGGDKAIWLQDTIEQRQEWTHGKITEIHNVLNAAAQHLGYADEAAAQTALIAVPSNKWTTAERAFLDGFTNVQFVDSEGSYGLHNWDYSREIVNKAMEQARIAQSGVVVKLPYKLTLTLSKSSVKAGAKVKYSGSVKTARGVPGAGKLKLMKLVGGVWKVWKSTSLNSAGKYSLTVKMTKKGTFHFRALMPADSLNKTGYSAKRKLVVK